MATKLRWRGLITGWVGNMASEKTNRFIARLKEPRKKRAGMMVFHPIESCRGDDQTVITSRTGASYRGAIPYERPEDILRFIREAKGAGKEVRHVFFDEVHFEDQTPRRSQAFQQVIRILSDQGINIYWSGLPRDFRGEPFMLVAWLMAVTDTLYPLDVECEKCGRRPASLPQRLRNGQPVSDNDPRFITDSDANVAAGDTYEPRCSQCHQLADE